MLSLSEDNQSEVIEVFSYTSRYLDDLLNTDNNFFESMVHHIYPSELQLNMAKVEDTEASFLDLYLSILDRFVKTKTYDKRDDFDFDIVNFPFLDWMLLVRDPMEFIVFNLLVLLECPGHVDGFNTRNKVLTSKLLKQGYRYQKFRKTS